jgi:hypothetical protein
MCSYSRSYDGEWNPPYSKLSQIQSHSSVGKLAIPYFIIIGHGVSVIDHSPLSWNPIPLSMAHCRAASGDGLPWRVGMCRLPSSSVGLDQRGSAILIAAQRCSRPLLENGLSLMFDPVLVPFVIEGRYRYLFAIARRSSAMSAT